MADYIEREALINELSASCMPIDDREISGLFDCDESIRDIIEAMPAANVHPESHGYFKPIFDNDSNRQRGLAIIYECSECRFRVNNYTYSRGLDYEFCPYCGAKMDGKGGDGNGQ